MCKIAFSRTKFILAYSAFLSRKAIATLKAFFCSISFNFLLIGKAFLTAIFSSTLLSLAKSFIEHFSTVIAWAFKAMYRMFSLSLFFFGKIGLRDSFSVLFLSWMLKWYNSVKNFKCFFPSKNMSNICSKVFWIFMISKINTNFKSKVIAESNNSIKKFFLCINEADRSKPMLFPIFPFSFSKRYSSFSVYKGRNIGSFLLWCKIHIKHLTYFSVKIKA